MGGGASTTKKADVLPNLDGARLTIQLQRRMHYRTDAAGAGGSIDFFHVELDANELFLHRGSDSGDVTRPNTPVENAADGAKEGGGGGGGGAPKCESPRALPVSQLAMADFDVAPREAFVALGDAQLHKILPVAVLRNT